ncbi:winged helix-turn-helix domain-containing protein [Methanocaldococcus indicus]|uniref:winged helix-turn-helix domain-containing protein n=1 Tax=Methanocaldococcus indicus TaxID=213231 RepID=UPI003C6D9799
MKRETAYKIYPNEFLENPVVDNYLILEGKKLRRVRILGKVYKENEKFYLEGIELRNFNDMENKIYDVIGKPRVEEDKFLEVEIYKERDENWIELRDLEIKITRKYLIEKAENLDNVEILKPEEIKEKILKLISDLGEVSFLELSEMLNIPDEELEKYLKELLEEGEIFEINGVYKLL